MEYPQLNPGNRRKRCLSAILGTGLALLPASLAQAQTYASYVTNPFNLVANGSQVKPAFADLDNDGDLDMLTGTNAGGTGTMFVYYENTGTRSIPSFASPVANPFVLPYTGALMTPTFADIDNDGDLDLFTGNQGGEILFIQNTGTVSAPVFTTIVPGAFGLYDVGSLSAPTFTDLDNDGDLDAMVGEYYSRIYYYQNTGTATAPAFGPVQTLPFGLATMPSGPRPEFMDMDGDGDQDMLAGFYSSGDIGYFENTGTISAPYFASPVFNTLGFTSLGTYLASVAAADLDFDGDLDVMAGDFSNVFKYFENTTPVPAPGDPTDTTPLVNLMVCHGASATLMASGTPTGTLGWYDAPTGGNYLGSGSPFVTAPLTAGTTFYVQDSTAGGTSPGRIPVAIDVADPISELSMTTGQTSYCESGTAVIVLNATQTGLSYALRNDLNDTIVHGPVSGSNGMIFFSTAEINMTTTYNVLAHYDATAFLACEKEMAQLLTITVNQPSMATGSVSICYGEDYTYADGTVSEGIIADESHISTLANQSTTGCDSIVTEYIVSLPQLLSSVTNTICFEEEIIVNGTTYNYNNPTGTEVFTGLNGCDSTVTINLNVLPAVTGALNPVVCHGETFVINGITLSEASPLGEMTLENASVNGCDSVVTITLTVLPELASTISNTICAEEAIVVNGTTYNAANPSGTEVFQNIGPNGCDSTVTIDLNVLPALASTYAQTICPDETVTINGTVYGQSNLAGTEVFTGANGCDSTVTVALTLSFSNLVGFAPGLPGWLEAFQVGAQYQWIDCSNNQPVAGATSQSFTATVDGAYAVIITMNGCTDTSMCVTPTPLVSLDETALALVSLYPNPAETTVTVSGLEALTGIRAISLLDINGKQISEFELNMTTWDISAIQPGIYYVKIAHEKGVETIKLLKK